MPYKNIVFVKLEKRLLNDHRWFTMSEKAQLLYIKLMLGCAETYNKLPSESLTLRQQLRITWKKSVFDSAIKEIENNFPKFKKDGNYYYFEDFENKTNYIRECPSNAQVLPKEGVYIDKEKDIDKEEDKEERIIGERTLIVKDYFLDLLPTDLNPEKVLAWADWVDYRKEIKKRLTKSTAKQQIQFLLSQPSFVACINQSIKNGWQGLFEIKKENVKTANHQYEQPKESKYDYK